jgi:hypothetical protein
MKECKMGNKKKKDTLTIADKEYISQNRDFTLATLSKNTDTKQVAIRKFLEDLPDEAEEVVEAVVVEEPVDTGHITTVKKDDNMAHDPTGKYGYTVMTPAASERIDENRQTPKLTNLKSFVMEPFKKV